MTLITSSKIITMKKISWKPLRPNYLPGIAFWPDTYGLWGWVGVLGDDKRLSVMELENRLWSGHSFFFI